VTVTRIWPAASGGSTVTPVDVTATPTSGTPSSIADGATADAGLVDGLYIHDPNGRLASVVDDGSQCRIVTNTGALGDVEFSDIDFFVKNAYFRHPDRIMGDCTVTLQFKLGGASTPVNATTQVALFLGYGDTENECRGAVVRCGDWQTTNARFSHYRGLGTSSQGAVDGTNRDTTSEWYIRILCVDNDITLSWSSDGSSWTDLDGPDGMDPRGGSFWAGFGVYSPVADTVDILSFSVSAPAEYTATP